MPHPCQKNGHCGHIALKTSIAKKQVFTSQLPQAHRDFRRTRKHGKINRKPAKKSVSVIKLFTLAKVLGNLKREAHGLHHLKHVDGHALR